MTRLALLAFPAAIAAATGAAPSPPATAATVHSPDADTDSWDEHLHGRAELSFERLEGVRTRRSGRGRGLQSLSNRDTNRVATESALRASLLGDYDASTPPPATTVYLQLALISVLNVNIQSQNFGAFLCHNKTWPSPHRTLTHPHSPPLTLRRNVRVVAHLLERRAAGLERHRVGRDRHDRGEL